MLLNSRKRRLCRPHVPNPPQHLRLFRAKMPARLRKPFALRTRLRRERRCRRSLAQIVVGGLHTNDYTLPPQARSAS